MKQRKSSSNGFSLIELLIALAVFSILSIMAYSGLQVVLDSKGHTEAQAERLVQVQRAFAIIQRDMEQVVGRSVRDEYGSESEALKGEPFGAVLMQFTRAGKRNPLGMPRSSLERVEYRFEDETFVRRSLPMLDQPDLAEPLERQLLTEVKEIKFRYFDASNQAQDVWSTRFSDEPDFTALPRGVEVVMNIAGIGEIKRLYRLAPGEYAAPERATSSTTGQNSNQNQNNN